MNGVKYKFLSISLVVTPRALSIYTLSLVYVSITFYASIQHNTLCVCVCVQSVRHIVRFAKITRSRFII